MNKIQISEIINTKNLTIALVAFGLIYLLVNSLVESRFQSIEQHTREQIANQQSLLAVIAETTARNGADPVTESIVRDCPVSERIQFDNLLGRLNMGLTRPQLVELELLFSRCGSFYSERKSVMVSRLSREIEIFEDYVEQLNIITGEDNLQAYSVEKWKFLANEELKQSKFFAELVVLQNKIISTLLDGRSADSLEISTILQQVSEVQQSLAVANKQTSVIRSELISL